MGRTKKTNKSIHKPIGEPSDVEALTKRVDDAIEAENRSLDSALGYQPDSSTMSDKPKEIVNPPSVEPFNTDIVQDSGIEINPKSTSVFDEPDDPFLPMDLPLAPTESASAPNSPAKIGKEISGDEEDDKRSAGRPKHVPTQANRDMVEQRRKKGDTQITIARAIGVCRDTLMEHYADEMAIGKELAHTELANVLHTAAIQAADDPRFGKLLEFALKTQHKYRERTEIDHTSSDGSMSQAPILMLGGGETPEVFASAVDRLKALQERALRDPHAEGENDDNTGDNTGQDT